MCGVSFAMRSKLYAAPTIFEAKSVRASPLKRVFRNSPVVFVQPKIFLTRFQIRWLIA